MFFILPFGYILPGQGLVKKILAGFSTRALSPVILCGVPFRVYVGKMKTMAVDEILSLLV